MTSDINLDYRIGHACVPSRYIYIRRSRAERHCLTITRHFKLAQSRRAYNQLVAMKISRPQTLLSN